MAATQLDTPGAPGDNWVLVDDESENHPQSSKSLSPCHSDPPPKRAKKLHIEKDCSRDRIRWIPGDTGLIPFVKCADTGIVHAGTHKMAVEKVGLITIVHCLSGCPDPRHDTNCTDQCQCLRHLLKEYYLERDLCSC